jgi:glycerate kinase
MCDIDNPMYGPKGASCIFGPQKGASQEAVAFLDEGVHHLADQIQKDIGLDLSETPGAGAAGAMGAGMIAFFGSRLQMGIETVLDVVKFDEIVQGADLVFTGEGMLDAQSLRGKVVLGVARRAKQQGVPVIAVAGDIKDDIGSIYEEGVSAAFSTNREAKRFDLVKSRAQEDLRFAMDNIMRTLLLHRACDTL